MGLGYQTCWKHALLHHFLDTWVGHGQSVGDIGEILLPPWMVTLPGSLVQSLQLLWLLKSKKTCLGSLVWSSFALMTPSCSWMTCMRAGWSKPLEVHQHLEVLQLHWMPGEMQVAWWESEGCHIACIMRDSAFVLTLLQHNVVLVGYARLLELGSCLHPSIVVRAVLILPVAHSRHWGLYGHELSHHHPSTTKEWFFVELMTFASAKATDELSAGLWDINKVFNPVWDAGWALVTIPIGLESVSKGPELGLSVSKSWSERATRPSMLLGCWVSD